MSVNTISKSSLIVCLFLHCVTLCLGVVNVTKQLTRVSQCEKNVPLHGVCACDTEEGVIDLRPLSSDPPLSFPGPDPGQTFYWNPCENFNKGTVIEAGMVEEIKGEFTEIGQAIENKISMGIDTATSLPIFMMLSSDVQRYAQVFCICDETKEFEMLFKGIWGNGIGAPITYGFDLTSQQCCPGFTRPPPSLPLSIGSCLVIGFNALFIVYVIIGMAFNKYVKKSTGNLFPNVALWTELIDLIWIGMRFVVSCGKIRGYDPLK